jgi:acetyl-CoA C-acetyltransferase
VTDVFIVGACRTAIGEYEGSLTGVPAVDLAARVIEEAVSRARLAPPDVEEVMVGNVVSTGLGLCPARQAAVKAGVPEESPALDVGMACASSLRAAALGAEAIARGDRRIVVAAGTENMSRVPREPEDLLIRDGLSCPIGCEHMGMTAERIAEDFGIGRGEQDEFAYRSHMRAVAAREEFSREIVPITVTGESGSEVFAVDERPRPDTSLEKLAALKPVFREGGTVTAGNASGVNDGAAAVVLASGGESEARGLAPIARMVGWAVAGVDPARMGLGPIPATKSLCEKLDMEVSGFDLVELNEAFSVQALAVMRELGLDPERTNVRGGAVALGHPIGCSGARILVTLIHAMQDMDAKKGLATLCVGSGMGMSLAVELP